MPDKPTLGGDLLHPSEYLAAVEFKGRDVSLTIADVKRDELQMKGGKKQIKPVLYFEETGKKLVVNATNAETIAALHGREAEGWIGKRITLFPTRAKFGRETVDAIRVRERVQPRKGGATPAPAPTATEPERDPDTGEEVPPASSLSGEPLLPE